MLIIKNLVSSKERENKVEGVYNYRLMKEESLIGQAYGIEVERQDFIDGVLVNIEREEINKISNIKEKVEKLLDMLHTNVVSPIHIVDILGEYVDNYVIDFN